MKSTNFILYLFLFVLSSCASSYKSINPASESYSNAETNDSISLNYQYDVLMRAGNKKYAKREFKRGIKVVALKITNNSGRTINPFLDLEIYSGRDKVQLLDPATVKKELKQSVPIYLLYLLLTPMNFNITKETNGIQTDKTTIPVGLIVGPGLSVINMATAGTANKNFEKELNKYSLNQVIQPGQTMYALVGLRSINYDPLRAKVVGK